MMSHSKRFRATFEDGLLPRAEAAGMEAPGWMVFVGDLIMGADYMEQDVVLTRDGVPIVLHDIQLDCTTDVALRFPDRARNDGRRR